ncbi:SusC/RagA family TonB-linked outer membrane protein [Chitinophaga sp. sic0106]|uniref:SusC/RagA family TonB-linked outer membrane protein n=1 Tax=Chitinophaga sp. sic0106 TaxID=2854785 RepID=UPI001C492F2A|nr:SusC/RagA family TonB-linked outer membrane protein [Chitinophaga sp. sic0106]MBV7533375.1 SusC/RagA family TonB-linked outer membrane protein [Chitinophaga sp. sic0106]
MQKSANRSTVLWPGFIRWLRQNGALKHYLLVMKLTAIIMCFSLLHVYATTFSQSVTVSAKGVSLKTIFSAIEKQTGYVVFYNKALLENTRGVTVKAEGMPLRSFLDQVFANQPLNYRIDGQNIVLMRKTMLADNVPVWAIALPIVISGKISDAAGNNLPGATVYIKGKKDHFAVSDAKGNYSLKCMEGDVLVFSYVGYKSHEIIAKTTSTINVVLQDDQQNIKDVVITGMMVRKKESFTGATASFTGDQLKTVNNQDIVSSLKLLDPSFVQIENNLAGSNPNVLPTIELRGQTSISSAGIRDRFSNDPNQPLFILNGFETTLQTIVDLDINLVASVTILKDAASTAIYGSRASNGVIVVETKKPVPGRLRVNYTADLQVEMPDLSSYNMMNASEKLQFEKLAGAYVERANNPQYQVYLDTIYNAHLRNVLRGVNTYWLDKPLQTGITQRHAVNASGGDAIFQYEVGFNYRANSGTMIGSKHNDWGVTLNLFYNTDRIRIGNMAYVSGNNLANSPYGSFATWANANPYYEIPSDNSTPYLEKIRTGYTPMDRNIMNPYYNAGLGSYDKGNGYTITDNFQVNIDVSKHFRIQGNGQVQKAMTESSTFISALNTQYLTQQDPMLRGSYTFARQTPFSYNANVSATYSQMLAQRHSLTAYARAEAAENRNSANGYKAIGFPNISNGNPAFAYGYEQSGVPNVANSVIRRNSFIGSVNYSFDGRYNVDLNASFDGSTAFGSNKRYQPYYSVGGSWNLHKEKFIKSLGIFDNLRLRGNVGLTGNQNFGNVSESVFKYYSAINGFGQGVYLSALGAPDLKWQNTLQTSFGLDADLLKGKVKLQVNGYRKLTDPLVVAITLPSSTGLSNYPFNAGTSVVNGWEFMATVFPIFKPNVAWSVGITGALLKQHYENFNNKLAGLNKDLQKSNSLTRYRDGYSSYDLWAVVSQGIDPATGREVFLRKDGQQTFVYDATDQVRVGTTNPKAQGAFNSSLTYYGFRASIFFSYIYSKDQFNTVLYNKVENITYAQLSNNQDKRALYDRWKQPGDMVAFKSIAESKSTPISSRFIQNENTISLSSFNIGYEFRDKPWLSKASLAALNLSAFTNDLFYISTIKRERGIEYPFARSVSFSLRATFK